jgi:glutaredoxin
MKLKIFTKQDCPNCPAAKALGKKMEAEGKKIEWFDLDEEYGLTEAVYFDVLSTPAMIITDENDNEVKAWRGEVPGLEVLKESLQDK